MERKLCASKAHKFRGIAQIGYIFQRLKVIVVAGAGGAVSGPLATIFAHEQLPNWSLLAHMAIGYSIGSMGPQAALVRARKVRKMTMLAPDDANE